MSSIQQKGYVRRSAKIKGTPILKLVMVKRLHLGKKKLVKKLINKIVKKLVKKLINKIVKKLVKKLINKIVKKLVL